MNVSILNALDASGEYAMPEDTLITQIGLTVPGARSSEVLDHLRTLEAGRLIVSVPGELDGPNKFTLTEMGRLKLRGLN